MNWVHYVPYLDCAMKPGRTLPKISRNDVRLPNWLHIHWFEKEVAYIKGFSSNIADKCEEILSAGMYE